MALQLSGLIAEEVTSEALPAETPYRAVEILSELVLDNMYRFKEIKTITICIRTSSRRDFKTKRISDTSKVSSCDDCSLWNGVTLSLRPEKS